MNPEPIAEAAPNPVYPTDGIAARIIKQAEKSLEQEIDQLLQPLKKRIEAIPYGTYCRGKSGETVDPHALRCRVKEIKEMLFNLAADHAKAAALDGFIQRINELESGIEELKYATRDL